MSFYDAIANAGQATFLSHNAANVKKDDKENAEQFAALLQAENAAPSQAAVAETAKMEKIAAHNAVVLAMVGEVPDAKQEFQDFMDLTPEERMRQQILQSMGLTEEDLEAMTPEERAAVEQKIGAIIAENARQNLEQASATENGKDADSSILF